MAKVLYIHEKREDYDIVHFFKNKKKMEAAKVELDKPDHHQDQEDYDQNKEWGIEFVKEGSFSYSKGLALFLGDVGDGNYYQDGMEFRDMTEEQFRAQAEKHVEVFDAGDEQGQGALLYYKGAIKEGTELYMDSRSGIVHDKGTQPTILVEDGEYHIGESVNTTFKYVPTFESFTAPQKVSKTNEDYFDSLPDWEKQAQMDSTVDMVTFKAKEFARRVKSAEEFSDKVGLKFKTPLMKIVKDVFKKEKLKF